MTAVYNNPTEENVADLIYALNNGPASVYNHPDTWNKIRGLWLVVNKSNKVFDIKLNQLIFATDIERKYINFFYSACKYKLSLYRT